LSFLPLAGESWIGGTVVASFIIRGGILVMTVSPDNNLPKPLFLWIMPALMVYPGAYNRRANFTLGMQNES